MKTDFTTWERSTLEQFAREARDKLIEDRAAIAELVGAMKEARALIRFYKRDTSECVTENRIDAAITKHQQPTTTKE